MRARLRYTKLGKVRFLGHRDLARCLERSLRRAEVPVARTQGFNPRARVSFGLALPTGAESLAEYVDVDLADAVVDLGGLPGALSAVLPPGVDVVAAGTVDPAEGSLQSSVTSSDWEVALPGADPAAVAAAVERSLAAPSLVVAVDRKGAQVEEDLRPAVLSLAADPAGGPGGSPLLHLRLASAGDAGGRSVRPGDVVEAVAATAGGDPFRRRARRTHQWIEAGGAPREPLPLPSSARPARTPPAVRAS